MMNTTYFAGYELDVKYVQHFIEKQQADDYFNQLKTVPYFTPTFKYRGRNVKPKRQVLAYGDFNTEYAFSGTSIPAQPWCPLMLELRDRVERHIGCTFNYVLLNFYIDGSSYISQHKDNDSALDSSIPTTVLSFGAKRTIDFKRPKYATKSIDLEHGSLYSIRSLTNELYTHGIAADPSVKEIRISLTFMYVIRQPLYSPLKKPRLEIDEKVPSCDSSPHSEHVTSYDSPCAIDLPSASDSFSDAVPSFDSSRPANEHSTPSIIPDQQPNDYLIEWFSKLFEEGDSVSPVLFELNLHLNTFLQIIMDKHLNLRINIRKFDVLLEGEKIPTLDGILMTPESWVYFQDQIRKLTFHSVNESFIANNQLVCICINENSCILQQMYPLNTSGYFLKPSVLTLTKDQILKLIKMSSDISESLIEIQFLKLLPAQILKKRPRCTNHFDALNARKHFLDCVLSEIISSTEKISNCLCCEMQMHHVCINSNLGSKFYMNRVKILLSLNLRRISRHVIKHCSCHFDLTFFQDFNMSYYEKCIEEVI